METELRHRLSNGMELHLLHDPGLERCSFATCQWVVRVGSSADPSGKKGLAHVLEHVVRRRPQETVSMYPRSLKAARWVKHLVARTDFDLTTFPMNAPGPYYGALFQYFARWWASVPIGQEEYIQGCVEDVIAEKSGSQESSPFGGLYDELYRVAFADHPYEAYPVGDLRDLTTITPADCRSFHRRHYGLENVSFTCSIGGHAEIRLEKVLKLAERAFSALGRRGSQRPTARVFGSAPFQDARERIVVRRLAPSAAGTAILAGLRIPPIRAADFVHLSLLQELLVGRNSLVHSRASEGCSAIGSYLSLGFRDSMLEILFSTSGRSHRRLAASLPGRLLEEMDRIAWGKLGEAEIDGARARFIARFAKFRYTYDFCELLTRFQLAGRSYSELSRAVELAEGTDRDAIRRAAREVFAPGKLTIVHSG